ncbi:PH domain-containing protein [Candidatus Parcubacteria bacterium]|nr:PH domain-containing protein [Candidatus Parcubacteria bacterium]
MEKLHPRAVWIFFASYLPILLPLIFVAFYFSEGALSIPFIRRFSGNISLRIVIALIIYAIFCFIFAKLAYRFWKYELTENSLKIEKGVIMKKYISIPYDRVQNVDIYRGVLARILGLSDLQIQTAGYSGGYGGRGHGFGSEGRLPGLAIDVAENLREKLVQSTINNKQGL